MGQHHHTSENPDVLSPVEARQGRTGWPVLYVLLISLGLVMAAWGVVELFF